MSELKPHNLIEPEPSKNTVNLVERFHRVLDAIPEASDDESLELTINFRMENPDEYYQNLRYIVKKAPVLLFIDVNTKSLEAWIGQDSTGRQRSPHNVMYEELNDYISQSGIKPDPDCFLNPYVYQNHEGKLVIPLPGKMLDLFHDYIKKGLITLPQIEDFCRKYNIRNIGI